MYNNNSQTLSSNNTIVPLQDSHEENQEPVVRVKKNRKTIKKGICLAIFLIVTAAIVVPILLVSKRSSNRSLSSTNNDSLSGRYHTFEYLYLSTFF